MLAGSGDMADRMLTGAIAAWIGKKFGWKGAAVGTAAAWVAGKFLPTIENAVRSFVGGQQQQQQAGQQQKSQSPLWSHVKKTPGLMSPGAMGLMSAFSEEMKYVSPIAFSVQAFTNPWMTSLT